MEIIRGKRSVFIDLPVLAGYLESYPRLLVDLGTGDGRFVQSAAGADAACLAIGIDTCRENLVPRSRRIPPNALYLIGPAQALPSALFGRATAISINFPWGSLLQGLLGAETKLMGGLAAIARPGASLQVHLNAEALADAGWSPEAGCLRVRDSLEAAGFRLRVPAGLGREELRRFPSSWARRLAFGRDPRAWLLAGKREVDGHETGGRDPPAAGSASRKISGCYFFRLAFRKSRMACEISTAVGTVGFPFRPCRPWSPPLTTMSVEGTPAAFRRASRVSA